MAAPVPEVFARAGLWTEEEFLATNPGNAAVDHAVKPQLYAHAGVPCYLRIELGEDGPRALVYQLTRHRYAEVAGVDPGQPLVLTEPIAVTLDLAALAATTRPPG